MEGQVKESLIERLCYVSSADPLRFCYCATSMVKDEVAYRKMQFRNLTMERLSLTTRILKLLSWIASSTSISFFTLTMRRSCIAIRDDDENSTLIEKKETEGFKSSPI